MSKVNQWLFGMQEDAYDMTLAEFITEHGASHANVWHEVQEEFDCLEMDDGA
jgi:hypothetical protein